ncbi:Bacterial type II secretion system protein F domain protein [Pseudovibrio axinellae]|uniref:Bacterial type II secretion system protein F domain protein n=1 Tax=Pseudovibrio axinellae TaxID=989403 RepID=A0A166B7K0_9HYPH|nr:type II secretion system F family protein [Pseudovibrio axinellae]KZL21988.1 Bacterial type II secretion system protein F domain protein [Pseudovibrio axinellae]SEQ59661.1 tight adherence protein C [Pseudovibrio axinellae]
MGLEALGNSNMFVVILTLLAVSGTVYALLMPLFDRDELKSRMKSVALEREEIRSRERARLAMQKENARVVLRSNPKESIRDFVDKYDLKRRLSSDGVASKLKMAGYRGASPLYTYLLFQVILPIGFFAVSFFYMVVIIKVDMPVLSVFLISLLIAAIGFYAPSIFIQNQIAKRQESIRLAWPDAMDLMLICVESGMSIEAAFKKVSEEVGAQSAPLAEELILANAELSFLDERRVAYQNLAERTGLDGVKNVIVALTQAEKYGTPIGSALRVLSDENRKERMQEAERKAAALPPKLTVPMMLFFLPVLFIVIIGPAAIQVMRTF